MNTYGGQLRRYAARSAIVAISVAGGLGVAAPNTALAAGDQCTTTVGPPTVTSLAPTNRFTIVYGATVTCTFQVDQVNLTVTLWQSLPGGDVQLASGGNTATAVFQDSWSGSYEEACSLGQSISVYASADAQITTSQPYTYRYVAANPQPAFCDLSPGGPV